MFKLVTYIACFLLPGALLLSILFIPIYVVFIIMGIVSIYAIVSMLYRMYKMIKNKELGNGRVGMGI
jgi:hypothetical protein